MKKPQISNKITKIKDINKITLSVDCVIFGYDEDSLKVLVIESNFPKYKGKLSLIGELVNNNETLEDAANRVVGYWTGLEGLYLEEIKSFSAIDRHPMGRVITIAFYSLLKMSDINIVDMRNQGLKWVNVKDEHDWAFDHQLIFVHALSKLRERVKDRPIGFNLLPKKFTLKQLQRLYEVILDIELDKRNFRRKITALDLLQDNNEYQKEVMHRPAKLFSFNNKEYIRRKKDGFKFEI